MDGRGRALARSRVRPAAARPSAGRPSASRRTAARLMAALVTVLAAVLFVRAVIVEPREVASESMEPTLHQGSVVLVDKIGPRLRGVHREDVVVFTSPDGGREAIKRVVAVGGQQVAIRDAELYVDGTLVEEPQVDSSRIDGTYFGPVTVPEDTVFVLGDSRSGSIDSRVYGPVPLDSIIGRVAVTW
jgi:signal peptidase I